MPDNIQTRTLSFVIIGAAKSGTTALFEYLRTHPDIALPREKETGFFALNQLFDRGWQWYIRSFLADLPAGKTYGDVSPAYMWGTPHSGTPLHAPSSLPPDAQPQGLAERVVPERIAKAIPEVKIICILRDPIYRAISHYQMGRLWGWEKRDLDTAMSELLIPEQIEQSRRWITGTTWYITLGEYGRILAPYLELFPSTQIHIVFSGDLLAKREQVLRDLFAFIDVDADWTPSNVDTRYRQAATTRRIPAIDLYRWRQSTATLRPLRSIWTHMPRRQQGSLNRLYDWLTFRNDLWNARRDAKRPVLDARVRSSLEHHYRADGSLLGRLIGQQPPWLEEWDARSGDERGYRRSHE